MNARHALSFLVCTISASSSTVLADKVDFERDVRPILQQACWKCHGPKKQQGGLRLDRRDAAVQAGDSGSKAIVPRHADESELIRRIEAADPSERMPLKADPLTIEQVKVLREWIDRGASWPESSSAASTARREMVVTDEDRQHWSYRRLTAVKEPAPTDQTWGKTAVDRFILAALEAKGIRPNPPAEPRTLIRRLYFDVIGLPPTPEEVDAFIKDPSPEAYSRLVDRLLASPHYGERWGRHWLDVARYADSNGMETDHDRPNAYHYRDFVIRALNRDLSYQTFVRWQLAGDEYEPDNPEALSATGFFTAAPNELLPEDHLEEERLRLRFNEMDDMAVTTISAFLGLTLGCARCHDHKYDAIPTRDYYRLQCAFTTTSRSDVFLASRADVARYRDQEKQWNERVKSAGERLSNWLREQKKPLTASLRKTKIEALPISPEDKKLLTAEPDSEVAKRLAKQHEKAIRVSDDEYRRGFTEDQRKQWDKLQSELNSAKESQPSPPPMALAIIDKKAEPEPTFLLERGDFYARKERLQVGFLSVLTGSRSPDDYWAEARREGPAGRSTLQRRALAEWMTDLEHGAGPLLARVIANRVWQHHFGEGLVRTVSDFGVRGEAATHPELLEWLAQEFVTNGWRLKHLHRLMLTSSVYRQATTFDEARGQVDPDNRLLWRRRPQRLEAEILRDAVLAVSGTLNTEPFGPAFKPPIPPEAMVARNTKTPYPTDAKDTHETRRRTVYMYHKRVVQHPLMQVFDGPDAAVSCGRRSCTTVAPQALALLNDPFLRARAIDFARRLLAGGSQPADWVEQGYRLALSRPPGDVERNACVQFVKDQLEQRTRRGQTSEEAHLQATADFCQTMFSLNEFVYVD